MNKPDHFQKLTEHWPSSMVARTEVRRFSGGILSGKTLANMACRGEAVPTATKIGKKVAYDAAELAAWLRTRSNGGTK